MSIPKAKLLDCHPQPILKRLNRLYQTYLRVPFLVYQVHSAQYAKLSALGSVCSVQYAQFSALSSVRSTQYAQLSTLSSVRLAQYAQFRTYAQLSTRTQLSGLSVS